ncbi:hypothetical protein SAMN06297358_1286 [Pedobacter xixiisoli]|uniref:Uncharacterized protein n=1 Tax=Pedobacter xixiisoli TaxID=1476464 RepID=A0A285ZW51_9SPHI|nr:hypothetical protein SAMN06297358_1286 [Pedobacter xixiisoli]
MRVFGRRKKLELSSSQDKLAQRMADRICRLQRKIADDLNVRTAGWGRRSWLVLLVLLCLLMGGYCAYLVIDALN